MASTAHTWNSLKFTINSFLVWPSFILSFYATCNILLKSEVFSSVIQSYPTLFDSMDCSTPGLSVHHQLKLMSIESVMPSNHLILCHPLLLLPSIFPSIRVFASESALCIRWPKYWSFSFNISPSNEYSGLISFRMDWLDLLAVQGTLRVFSNTTVQKHQFFSAQTSSQSNSYVYTWPQEKP